jgi:cytochrome c biogenesis protein CcmG/thiol:disulfide interchange protein DsbE
LNRKVLIAGLVVTLPLLGILFANLGRDPHAVDSPLIGRPAPPFSLQPIGGGEEVSLEGLRGRPVVVNFWATWCVPCYQEHGVLTRAARAIGADAQFLGIIYEDEEPRVRRFLREQGSAYPSLLDDDGKTAIAFGVYGVPETFFIDASGKIVAKHVGPVDADIVAQNLRVAMRSSGGASGAQP